MLLLSIDNFNEILQQRHNLTINFVKIFKLFLGTKYLWGGKSCDGIDCSALIEMYYYYNNLFFPRDTRDQIKYCRKKSKKNFKPGNIIFWTMYPIMCYSCLSTLTRPDVLQCNSAALCHHPTSPSCTQPKISASTALVIVHTIPPIAI